MQAIKLGIRVDTKRHKQVVYVATFSVIGVNLIAFLSVPFFFVHSGFITESKPIVSFGYAHAALYRLFYTMQFSLASLAVRERFKLLNNQLR